ncbi:MAG: DNA translocase FtsK 4TM domain-containing protein [Phycisphaerae bacterium]
MQRDHRSGKLCSGLATARPSRARAFLLPICALATAAFLWPAVLTFDPGDWPSPNQFPHNTPCSNACGIVGAWCSYHLVYYIGNSTYALLAYATLAALIRISGGEITNLPERLFGLGIVVACTSAAAHLMSATAVTPLPVGNGGVIGFGLGELLTQSLSHVGTLIVLASSLVVGLLFATEGWTHAIPRFLVKMGRLWVRLTPSRSTGAASPARSPVPSAAHGGAAPDETEALIRVTHPGPKARIDGIRATSRTDSDIGSDPSFDHRVGPASGGRGTESESVTAHTRDQQWGDSTPYASVPAAPVDARRSGVRDDTGYAAKPKGLLRRRSDPKVNVRPTGAPPRAEAYPRQIDNWRLPSVDLLREPDYEFTSKQEAAVRHKARTLERTLAEFRLDAHVVEIDTGPVITMYELKLGAGIKVSQIASLSNDIARALKAHAIRVVAPISGKNTVGIEVPNVDKEKVRLKDLIALAGRRGSEMGLPLFFGKDSGGAAIVADLTKMPHLLIAGTTGSGKSVCLNAIIVSLLMMKRPDHVKIIIIDPKMVEMTPFRNVPHLMCPIVTDLAQSERILDWAVTKMEERYAILAEAGVRNITDYNKLGKREIYRRLQPMSDAERTRTPVHLPYMVILIDELADLMMTSAKEVEHHLCRLAQKSRAVGIHIIVATQRPEARVVTGLIKSNLPARICFRVASRMDSRIVLDQNGGEVLMGQGDLLFLPPGSHKLMRAQGTFLEDSEVRAVIDDLTSRAKPEFHPELVGMKSAGRSRSSGVKDPLFDEAVRMIIESKRGSVSLLQRRLTIGYSRASRLVDQMAEAGIVGDYKGSQAREVLISRDQWEAMRSHLAVELQSGYKADQEDPVEQDATNQVES